MKPETLRAALLLDGLDNETIDAFFAYHALNKQIWYWFQRFTFEAIDKGKKIGSKAVAERIRWEVRINYAGSFKLNNDYPAYYARAFALKFPKHKNYFSKRKISGLAKKRNRDVRYFNDKEAA